MIGTPLGDKRRDARVLWLSHGYGYGGRLLYFKDIFVRVFRIFPRSIVFVERVTVLANPEFSRWFRRVSFTKFQIKRSINGVIYASEVRFPSISFVFSMLKAAPDVAIIIEFTPIALLGFAIVKGLLRRPVVLLVENDPSFRGAPRSTFFNVVKGLVARNADRVMTNTPAGGRYITEALGVPASRVVVAPYLTSAPPRPATEDAVATRPTGALTLLFANSITARKGLVELLRALTLLQPEARALVRLVVVGDGPALPEARRFVEDNALDANVEFRGSLPYDQMWKAFALADVFVSTTLSDYRSLTGFEALSFGKPVLLSKYDGAHPEVVADGLNGFVLDPLDPADVARRISWFVTNRGRVAEMAAVSAVKFQDLTPDRIAENITSIIDEVLCAHHGRRFSKKRIANRTGRVVDHLEP